MGRVLRQCFVFHLTRKKYIQKTEVSILTFNLHCFIDLPRRFAFANAIIPYNPDILCLTETWLTEEVSNKALFLKNYVIHRNDRTSKSGVSKHGGVLVAVKDNIQSEELFVKNTYEDCLISKINTKNDSILIVCIYNAPKDSPYRWCKQKFEDLTQTLKYLEKKTKPKSIIIAGDLNFLTTDWKKMSSPDELDDTWLNYFIDENFEQRLNFTNLLGYKKQLDFFLTNKPQFWINSKIEFNISYNYALNNKKSPDHYAYITRYECNHDHATNRSRPKYAHKRIDWINFNCNISKNPFNHYCYSNVDDLLKQWYEWFNRLFDQNVPGVTQHRSQLPLGCQKAHPMK